MRPARVRVSTYQAAASSSSAAATHGELVAGIAEPGKGDAEVERRRHRLGVGAEDAQRDLLDDVEQADGGDDGAFRLVVEPPQHQPFRQQRDRADDQRGDDQRGDESHRRRRRQHFATHQAITAPSMKNSPWATLTTRMTPNTSDSPSAVSASTAAVTMPSRRASRRWGPKDKKNRLAEFDCTVGRTAAKPSSAAAPTVGG